MSEMTTRVAAALEQFITEHGMWSDNGDGTVLVEAIFDPVELARAAVDGLRLAVEENLDRTKSFRTDRHDAIIDFLTYDVLE